MDNIEHDRLISSDESKDDKAFDRAIRPQSLKEYVGQKNMFFLGISGYFRHLGISWPLEMVENMFLFRNFRMLPENMSPHSVKFG